MSFKPYPQYKEAGIPWLEIIPFHWKVNRAKWLFIKMERPTQVEDEVITCFRDGCVTLRKLRRLTGFTESLKEIGYQGIRKGDLVIHQMDAFAGAIGVSDSDGKGTPVYSVCIPVDKDFSTHYYAGIVREMARSEFILSLSRGIRERSSDFRFESFKNQFLPIPPTNEQYQIARYLDWKTSQIAKFIKAKKRLIELLKEQKQVIINDAVTGKVDVRTGKPYPKYKDSGVEWLGTVPEKWEIIKLKFFASLAGRIGFHGLSSNDYKDQGIILVTGTDFMNGWINWDNCHRIDESWYEKDINIQLKEGDLLITKDGTIGKTAIVNELSEKAVLNSGVMVIRAKKTYAYSNDFLMYLINSVVFKRFIDLKKTGATVQHLYQETFNNFMVAFPGIDIQSIIVTTLRKRIRKIDRSIEVIENQISTLNEFRAKLIADAVTGKIDVRDIAVPDIKKENMLEEVEDTVEIEEDIKEATVDNEL